MNVKNGIPIRSDLFRFVTFRSPNLIKPKARFGQFIFHPDFSKSYFHDCPQNESQLKERLKNFSAFSSYREVEAIHPGLFELGMELTDGIPTSLNNPKNVIAPLAEDQELKTWDNLFFEVLSLRSPNIRQACLKLLIAHRVVTRKSHSEEDFSRYKVVLPVELINCIQKVRKRDCEGELYGVNHLGIADFRRVEQEVCCYVPGEVSHIENVLAKEYKERHTRNLVSSEVTTETDTEVEMESLSDNVTTSRNQLNSEIATVLDQQNSNNYGGSLGVSGSYFGAEINANAFANFANANASSYSSASATQYAQEVVRRALERITRRTTQRRTVRILKEFEENNKHGFDNREGEEHVTGIYRWIDAIHTSRLVNYGKRLMLEFLIPEPAKFYKEARDYRSQNKPVDNGQGGGTGSDEVKTPEELGIKGPEDINRANYSILASEYGISIAAPSEEQKIVSQAFSPNPPIQHNGQTWTQTAQITIPQNYEAELLSGNFSFEYKAWGFAPDAHFTYDIGGITGGQTQLRSRSKKTENGSLSGNFTPKLAVQVPVVFSGRQLYTYSMTVTLTCRLKQSIYQAWQNAAYTQIVNAYQQIQASNPPSDPSLPIDPNNDNPSTFREGPAAFNRIVEQRELKRAAVSMLSKPFCYEVGRSWYDDKNACDKYSVPDLNQNAHFDAYSSQVKFFEQAFEWKLMSYIFYPYYWADPCDWAELVQSHNGDPVFQAFLQSGMARLVVPVRPEFTEAILYFMESGEIWLGGDLAVQTPDDFYLSVLSDLNQPNGKVEEEWEVRVPTTLAMVQKNGATVDEEGLPCCQKVERGELTNNISPTSNTLQLKKS